MVIGCSAGEVILRGTCPIVREATMSELLVIILARIGANLLESLLLRLAQALFSAAFRPKVVVAA
jgi:hypothetical protein